MRHRNPTIASSVLYHDPLCRKATSDENSVEATRVSSYSAVTPLYTPKACGDGFVESKGINTPHMNQRVYRTSEPCDALLGTEETCSLSGRSDKAQETHQENVTLDPELKTPNAKDKSEVIQQQQQQQQHVYRNIPHPVEVTVPHYKAVPVEVVIDRNVPIPVEIHVTQEFLCPRLVANHYEVPLEIPVKRTVEVPVPADAMSNSMLVEHYLNEKRREHNTRYNGGWVQLLSAKRIPRLPVLQDTDSSYPLTPYGANYGTTFCNGMALNPDNGSARMSSYAGLSSSYRGAPLH